MKFPGVGPRQAARFAFHLLRAEPAELATLADAIRRLSDEVKFCSRCYKTFDVSRSAGAELCEICASPRRNQGQIMAVEKEADLETIERSGRYGGTYHVLGGTVSPLDSDAPARLHLRELFERVRSLASSGEPVEVILATNPTTEGDATALYLERIFAPLGRERPGLALSRLGRGLNTGSELEYVDELTIASALENRK